MKTYRVRLEPCCKIPSEGWDIAIEKVQVLVKANDPEEARLTALESFLDLKDHYLYMTVKNDGVEEISHEESEAGSH